MNPKKTNEYIEQMSIILDLPLQSEHKIGVIQNFETIIKIAQLVTEYPLPETIEPAPKFEP
ncbi:MAG TPA: DUF4089 domain-containing protein [Halomicronema sp.]